MLYYLEYFSKRFLSLKIWVPGGGGSKKIKLWKLILLSITFIIVVYRSQSSVELSKLTYNEKYTSRNLKRYPMNKRPISSSKDNIFQSGCRDIQVEMKQPRANAAMVILARNSDLDGVILSMKSLERHFNQWFNYPWVILNNEKFSKDFKDKVSAIASGPIEFGIIPPSHWKIPEEKTDPNFFREALHSQELRGIRNGESASYHKMCRYFSGYFYKHRLIKKYDWYWRVEPDVEFFCDLTYDPFLEMERSGKVYGFTVMIKELPETIPSLFRYTKAFIKEKNITLPDTWSLFAKNLDFYSGKNEQKYFSVNDKTQFWKLLTQQTRINHAIEQSNNLGEDEDADTTLDPNSLKLLVEQSTENNLLTTGIDTLDKSEYNLCHFWSNFEIARTDFFGKPPYFTYFKYLDESTGFFTERWGDAPVHSLGAGMFLNLSQIHYFRDIGYQHTTIRHCPANSPNQLPYESSLGYSEPYTKQEEEVFKKYSQVNDDDKVGTGCRCHCPKDKTKEIENIEGTCADVWASVTDNERPHEKRLDLDLIEIKAIELYREYLKSHNNNGEDWELSKHDIMLLEESVL